MSGRALVRSRKGQQAMALRGAEISRFSTIRGGEEVTEPSFNVSLRAGISQHLKNATDSTFESSVGSWSDANSNLLTFSANNDAVTDGAITYNDVLTIAPNTNSAVHKIELTGILTVNRYYKLAITYYIESDNSTVAGLLAEYSNGTTGTIEEFTTTGGWVTQEVEFQALGTDLSITVTDGAGTTTLAGGGTGDDVSHIHRITVDETAVFKGSVHFSKPASEDTEFYMSDFSSGVDGWSGDATVMRTGNVDGVTDDLGESVDNVLECELDSPTGGNSQFRSWKSFSPTSGKRYRVEMKVYFPSSNTKIDGFIIQQLGTGAFIRSAFHTQVNTGFEYPIGEWFTFSFEFTATGTGLYIRAYDGGSGGNSMSSGDSNFYYIAYMNVYEVENIGTVEWEDPSTGLFEIFSGGHDGIVDEDGVSEDGCLKVSADNTNGNHIAQWENILEVGKNYRITIRAFVPSDNTAFDSLDLGIASGSPVRFRFFIDGSKLGKWITFSLDIRATGTHFQLIPTDGGSTNFTGTRESDFLYIKELMIVELPYRELFYPYGWKDNSDYGVTDVDTDYSEIIGLVNGVSDGSVSYDNCLRCTLNSSFGFHRIRFSDCLEVGVEYSFRVRFYIPSSNTDLDGVVFRLDAAGTEFIDTRGGGSAGSWTEVSGTVTPTAGQTFIDVLGYDGFSDGYTGNGSDLFYLHVVEITPNKPEIGNNGNPLRFGFISATSELRNPTENPNHQLIFTQPGNATGEQPTGFCFYYSEYYTDGAWLPSPFKTRQDKEAAFQAEVDGFVFQCIVNGAVSFEGRDNEFISKFGAWGNLDDPAVPYTPFRFAASVVSDSLTFLSQFALAWDELHDDTGADGDNLVSSVADYEADADDTFENILAGNNQILLVVQNFFGDAGIPDESANGALEKFALWWEPEEYELELDDISLKRESEVI